MVRQSTYHDRVSTASADISEGHGVGNHGGIAEVNDITELSTHGHLNGHVRTRALNRIGETTQNEAQIQGGNRLIRRLRSNYQGQGAD